MVALWHRRTLRHVEEHGSAQQSPSAPDMLASPSGEMHGNMTRVGIRSVLTVGVLSLTLVGCNSGYTQEEVDTLVAQAVDKAIAAEQSERISEEEAQAQADEAARQVSLIAAVESCNSSPYISVDAGGLVMESEGDGKAQAPLLWMSCAS